MGFDVKPICPGITHIRDAMGVCMTLLEGEQAALLVDTGYGTEDVSAFVRQLTDKPVSVMLTHHHHDHALGARWFDETLMLPADLPEWPVFTGIEKRRAVLGQAIAKGIEVSEQFLVGEIAPPKTLSKGWFDLGSLRVDVIPCPGHTPGSCVVYVPEHKLLLTGDNWNPCTWLFFDAALPVEGYRENIRMLQKLDFTHVLCSHQLDCFSRSSFDDFVNCLTNAVLDAAKPVKIGGWEHVDTRQTEVTKDQILVFDWGKYRKE